MSWVRDGNHSRGASLAITGIEQQSAAWFTFRSKGGPGNPFSTAVGASDAGTIMGVSPYQTVDELWEQKLGIREFSGNNYIMQRGIDLEPDARLLYSQIVGIPFLPDCFYSDKYPWMIWSSDGYNANHHKGIEIKLYGKNDFHLLLAMEVPEKHRFQLVQAMAVANLDEIDLVGYYCPKGTERYQGQIASLTVFRDKAVEEELVERELAFLRCVEEGVRPSSVPPFLSKQIVDFASEKGLE